MPGKGQETGGGGFGKALSLSSEVSAYDNLARAGIVEANDLSYKLDFN